MCEPVLIDSALWTWSDANSGTCTPAFNWVSDSAHADWQNTTAYKDDIKITCFSGCEGCSLFDYCTARKK